VNILTNFETLDFINLDEMMWEGPEGPIISCAKGTFYTLIGDYLYLVDVDGNRIVDENGNYILIDDSTVGLKTSIISSQGSYSLTGTDVQISRSRVIGLSSGVFTVTGSSVNIGRNPILALPNGAFALLGTDVHLSRKRLLAATKGNFVLSGKGVSFFLIPPAHPQFWVF